MQLLIKVTHKPSGYSEVVKSMNEAIQMLEETLTPHQIETVLNRKDVSDLKVEYIYG